MPHCILRRAVVVFAVTFAALLGAPALAQDDEQCFTCHNDASLVKTLPDGQTVSLYVDEEIYAINVHSGIGCIACHSDISELPHPEMLAKVDCSTCHDEAKLYEASVHGKALLRGDTDVATCADCHGKHDMRPTADPLSMTNKHNMPETCGKCHSDVNLVKQHMVSISKPSESYLQGVHAKAIAAGNQDAAVCTDCHGSHEILASNDPNSPISRYHIHSTCGKCHAEETAEFEQSIHGKALLAGIKDAPTCTDCHGEHAIEPPASATSPVGQQLVSRSTCPRCHDDERIMTRYGIVMERQASYMDSYHGMASAAGSKVVASCASCHGAHNILPASDPASSIHIANLPDTCAKCHEGAGPNFAAGKVHIMPTDPGQRALGMVRLVYLWLIALLLGGMVVHNSLMMLRHMMTKLWSELGGAHTYKRFSMGQTIGHLILTVSFVALAVSGFALRYPDNFILRWMFLNDAGFELRGWIHRVAGVVLIVLILVHFLHSIVRPYGRKELLALLPRWRDLRDVVHNLGYIIGVVKEQPRFDRYSYSEKMEYWGMMWGSVLMGITGVCMWYAEDFLRYFPKIVLDIAALIHFYEAWLAVGTIVIWHMYYMVLDPKTYPMNWSWITGRITEEDFKEHHPEEFERVTGKPAVESPAAVEKAEPALASTIPARKSADDAVTKEGPGARS